ncbi:MAG: ABC transporter permease subunit [Mageeibacillus sp.]|jgi:ABC-type Na+ efflux pump permease subunit|nr:ABC transporter permease subunit [Mageeibacillus sp.]MCI1263890.1 ABC transporter permease subunit [Saccharofermentans sp.]MCI1769762.1 ABC transporter permease subunit [Mageeibacillus sp.]MCI2043760.1 ABC transporter permease subunit [Mageeibacillus sp.]
MNSVVIIFRWEINKIFSSWRKAAAYFLLPALLLMIALNIFPLLINYMSTGSLSRRPVYVIDAPESFRNYTDDTADAKVYDYRFISSADFLALQENNDEYMRLLKGGTCFCCFWVKGEASGSTADFDSAVSAYYEALQKGSKNASSKAVISLAYSENSLVAQAQAEQLDQGVITPYKKTLITTLGGDYAAVGKDIFSTDGFNPVTKLLDLRTTANSAASRVIPGVLMILMYYCVYSLASDMFASERDRGFLSKLLMTPVSPRSIFTGKILAINVISSSATYATLLLMFLSSWANRGNDAMSLLPFGMLLTPLQLISILLTVPVTVFLMTAVAISVIFSLEQMQDITANLQLPLVLFLGDFFIQMFRGTRPVTLEYFIPLHNSLELISETFNSQDKTWHILAVTLLNLATGIFVLRKTYRKEDFK